ncbi:hypothetical protein MuYL_1228 [Mucilaginibacter xinganensis]|uniref:Uncharacterized protein n=1 Tax=Mucilaginibacter xinganensis TaxID=1234841 RepID=A0A223NU11_9SPHI|nr:hypothetical protein MuYL_1228 [Mucilaginibacter xinganensis]
MLTSTTLPAFSALIFEQIIVKPLVQIYPDATDNYVIRIIFKNDFGYKYLKTIGVGLV